MHPYRLILLPSFPPILFYLKEINALLPPQVASGGATGMERGGVESLIYLRLSGPGRPQFVCVQKRRWGWWWGLGVFTKDAGRKVSFPPWPLGLAQRKPLSVSLGHVCASVCAVRGCKSVTVQSDIHTFFFFLLSSISLLHTHTQTHTHTNGNTTNIFRYVTILLMAP